MVERVKDLSNHFTIDYKLKRYYFGYVRLNQMDS